MRLDILDVLVGSLLHCFVIFDIFDEGEQVDHIELLIAIHLVDLEDEVTSIGEKFVGGTFLVDYALQQLPIESTIVDLLHAPVEKSCHFVCNFG